MTNDSKSKAVSASSPAKPLKGYGSTVNWINPQLNDSDVTWLQSNEKDLVSLILEFVDDITETEKISIKYDNHSNRWLAILFAGSGDSRNSGCALSVRGATPFDAFCALAYFHIIRFARDYDASKGGTFGKWG